MRYDTTQDERLMALLSYLLGIILPVLAPAVFYFLKRAESRFVAFHALQCLAIHLTVLVIAAGLVMAGMILSLLGPLAVLVVLLPFVFLAVGLTAFLFQLVAGIKAYAGQLIALPWVGGLLRKQTGV